MMKYRAIFHQLIYILLVMNTTFYAHAATNEKDENMVELIFALKITDEEKYREYRNAIHPLMHRLGIIVLKEYRISEVVHSNDERESVNMLAMFGFPSTEIKEEFFSSNIYKNAKALFKESTTNFSVLRD